MPGLSRIGGPYGLAPAGSPITQPSTGNTLSPSTRDDRQVVMLLDNHYGPDPRVALEIELLQGAGITTRVVAWDRRSETDVHDQPASSAEIVRIAVPAPSGGGARSLVAALRFGERVWRRRGLFENASLLIVHDVYLLPLGWMLARRLGLPFVYDAHEEFERMERGRYPAWLLRLVVAMESRLARSAAAVTVPGASRVARWEGILDRAPIVLPNLVRRDRPVHEAAPNEFDLLYVGTVGEARHMDLLIELARLRPELRIGIAGRGRSASEVERAAGSLANLSYLGWRSDADALLERTTAIYYGLDPDHPYSDVACPNTLYQTLVHRKPLIFFCGGEPAQLAAEFKIGIRCEASVAALSAATDEASRAHDWEFDEAWRVVWERAQTQQFVSVVTASARQRH